MLLIHNQISVLSKILASKIQHQEIIEHQQAVTATLNKVAVPARSRKSSSNTDTFSQTGSNKEKHIYGVHGNLISTDRNVENVSTGSKTNESGQTFDGNKNNSNTDSTGCVIS